MYKMILSDFFPNSRKTSTRNSKNPKKGQLMDVHSKPERKQMQVTTLLVDLITIPRINNL